MKPHNNGHHPTLNLESFETLMDGSNDLSQPPKRMKTRNNHKPPHLDLKLLPINERNSPSMYLFPTFDGSQGLFTPIPNRYPVYSPATLSAKWEDYFDPSKIPADWQWWETPYGNILHWNHPIDYEKHGGSKKDKAKYGPKTSIEEVATAKEMAAGKETATPKLSSEKTTTKAPTSRRVSSDRTNTSNIKQQPQSKTPVPIRTDKQAENVKYYNILNSTSPPRSYFVGLKRPAKNKKQTPLKSVMKPPYRIYHIQKHVHFEDELSPKSKTLHQVSKFKNSILKFQVKLSAIPSPRCMAVRAEVATKVFTMKAREALTSDSEDYIPSPVKESTWCAPLKSFKAARVLGAREGWARLHKRGFLVQRTMK
jgi:hypothetical protein